MTFAIRDSRSKTGLAMSMLSKEEAFWNNVEKSERNINEYN